MGDTTFTPHTPQGPLIEWAFIDDAHPDARIAMDALLRKVREGSYVLSNFSPFVAMDGTRYIFVLLQRPDFNDEVSSRAIHLQVEAQVQAQVAAQARLSGQVLPAGGGPQRGRR